jgi:hypothetical protein
MSYDYFLQACLNTNPHQIPTERILAIFEPYIVNKRPDYLEVEFEQNNHCTIFMDTEAPGNDCINVHRPCGGEPFVRCLYEIMQLGHVVFFELDGIKAITLSSEMGKHLLDGMLDSMGPPVVASSWKEFRQLWQDNRI